MTQQNGNKSLRWQLLKLLNWALTILFVFVMLAALNQKLLLAAIAFLLMALILFPPLFNILRSKLSILKNGYIRNGILIALFIIACLNLPKAVTSSSAVKEKVKDTVENTTDVKEVATVDSNISTNNNARSNVIQGIQPEDVYLNFEKLGYETDKKISSNFSTFTSTFSENGIDYSVMIYCENGGVTDITAIELQATRTYSQYNKVGDMKAFLKYGCSVPYDGADIEKVKAFIDNNYFKNNATIVISGVRFTINVPTEFVRLVTIQKDIR